MRRLRLRHCGNILQYSHGSIATPSTPQLEQVSVTSSRLDDVWNSRTKVMTTCEINFRYHTVGLVLSQRHYFHARNYERYGTKIRYIILLLWKFCINSNEKTSLIIAVRCLWKRCWCRKITLFGFMLWWNCGWGVVFWNTQNNRRTILIYKVHSRCVLNRNK